MRDFKNPKARELFLTSLAIDEARRKIEEEDIKTCGSVDEYAAELGCQAAGYRVMADEIEDGIIDEEEAELLI